MDAILNLLHIPTDNPWVNGLIEASLIIALFSGLLIFGPKILRPLIKKLVGRFQAHPDDKIISAFLSFLRKILIFVGMEAALEALPLPPHVEIWVNNTIFVIVAFFVLLALFDLIEVVSRLIGVRAREFEVLVNRILKILAATIVVMVTMRHFNYDIWHIMTALGVGTLAVGLAAQPTLTNMIAGFTILLDRPFRRGDRIALTGGDTGEVLSIGMRSTHILTPDGNMLIVANADIMNTRVTNYSFPNSQMNNKIKFYFEKDGPINQIKESLKTIIADAPGVAKNSTSILITNINDWGVEITVSYNAEHYSQIGKIADVIMDSAVSKFAQEKIRMATNPFPIQTKT